MANDCRIELQGLERGPAGYVVTFQVSGEKATFKVPVAVEIDAAQSSVIRLAQHELHRISSGLAQAVQGLELSEEELAELRPTFG